MVDKVEEKLKGKELEAAAEKESLKTEAPKPIKEKTKSRL